MPELVVKDGGLHRKTVVENFEPVELSQLQGNVDQRQNEVDSAVDNLVHVARGAQSIEELTDARDAESKAQAALVEAKSEFENGSQLVEQHGIGVVAGTEEVDGDVENQY